MLLLRYPPLHFIVLGLALYLGQQVWFSDSNNLEILELLDPVVEERLKTEWQRAMRRPPNETELSQLIDSEINDEILFREALRLDLHLYDPVVSWRLLRNMRFLGTSADDTNQSLLKQALQMDMHKNDLVIRRRLVQVMEMKFASPANKQAATEEELLQTMEQQPELYTTPEKIRLSHVYFSRDRRPDADQQDARQLYDQAMSGSFDLQDAINQGDPFLSGNVFPLLSETQIASYFGRDFANKTLTLQPDQWSTPIESPYGTHLVWLHERTPSKLANPQLPGVREKLLYQWRYDLCKKLLAVEISALRNKYGVTQ